MATHPDGKNPRMVGLGTSLQVRAGDLGTYMDRFLQQKNRNRADWGHEEKELYVGKKGSERWEVGEYCSGYSPLHPH